MSAPPLFDEPARIARRERAARAAGERVFADRAWADVEDRIRDNARRFESALLLGALDAGWRDRLAGLVGRVDVVDPAPLLATRTGGVAAAEHALPAAPASYDLVVAAGTLDSAAALPAALLGIRRLLRPDGLLLGAVAGAGSLPRLRAALLAADELAGAAAPRIHPALDPRTLGDLLAKTGYVLCVVDVDRVRVGYGRALSLVRDLRVHGATNILARRARRPLLRRDLAAIEAAFAPNGRAYEEVNILHFSAWTPGPNQPQPAKPGSATASLAAALKPPR